MLFISFICICSINSVFAFKESPEPCTPYPMCKLFNEDEKIMTDTSRLTLPSKVEVNKDSEDDKELDEQKKELDDAVGVKK